MWGFKFLTGWVVLLYVSGYIMKLGRRRTAILRWPPKGFKIHLLTRVRVANPQVSLSYNFPHSCELWVSHRNKVTEATIWPSRISLAYTFNFACYDTAIKQLISFARKGLLPPSCQYGSKMVAPRFNLIVFTTASHT
jgi:hypothetical protein